MLSPIVPREVSEHAERKRPHPVDGAIAGETVPAQSSDIADGVENPESPASSAGIVQLSYEACFWKQAVYDPRRAT